MDLAKTFQFKFIGKLFKVLAKTFQYEFVGKLFTKPFSF